MIEKITDMLEELYDRNDRQKKTAYEEEDWEKFDLFMHRNEGVYSATKIVQEVAKDGGWIPVEVAMPEEHESIFAKFKGTDVWDEAMFEKLSDDVSVTIEFLSGTRKTKVLHTVDGKWTDGVNANYKVIAWQPLPVPYQKGDN